MTKMGCNMRHDKIIRMSASEVRLRNRLSVVLLTAVSIGIAVLGYRLNKSQHAALNAQMLADRQLLRAELIVTSSPYATVVCDEQGKIILTNAAAQSLLGWDGKELVGQSSSVLIPPEFRDQHDKGMDSARAKILGHKGNWLLDRKNVPLHALRKDGTQVAVVASIRVIKYQSVVEFIFGMRQANDVEPQKEPTLEPLPELPSGNVSIERAISGLPAESFSHQEQGQSR